MAMTSMRCPVLGAYVTFVTDFEGGVSNIFCPEYEAATATCRLKTASSSGGPLSQLLDRVSEDSLSSRSKACVLRTG